jgi:hypothetical protein
MTKSSVTRLTRFIRCQHEHVQDFSECCLDCGENIYMTVEQIRQEEAEKARRAAEVWNEGGW